MWIDYLARLDEIEANRNTTLAICLSPVIPELPLPIQRFDEPLLPYGKAIIAATQDLVAAYIFDFAAYLSLGAAGIVALERTLGFVGRGCVKILHGPFHGTAYSPMADAIAFNLDAITVSHQGFLSHYLSNPPYAAYTVNLVPESLENGGVYAQEKGILTAYKGGQAQHRLSVFPDHELNRHRGFDFDKDIRKQVIAWQQEPKI